MDEYCRQLECKFGFVICGIWSESDMTRPDPELHEGCAPQTARLLFWEWCAVANENVEHTLGWWRSDCIDSSGRHTSSG